MKNTMKISLAAALLAGSALADGLTQPHPGYTLTDIHPSGSRYLVGGLGTYSNGDLAVCNWGNPGDVYLLKNPRSGGAGSHGAKRFAMGLQQVMGCKVVRDTLFVMQMGELTAVVDTDKDGVADEYLKINDNFSTSESLLAYAFDVEYLQGNFYITLSSDVMRGGMDANPSLKERSVFMRLGTDNTSDMLSSGFRNPNGMGRGFGNRLFAVDNQGSWTPLSKIIYLQKGKFYGHHNHTAAPFENQPETWPMLWLPRGSVDYQPGNLAFFKEGIFKGQFLFAQPDKRIPGRVYRVYAEDVGGVMQGGIVAFSGGLGGAHRVHIDENNVVYVGNLNSNGGWNGVSTMDPGLKRLTPKGDVNAAATFEILRVRSTGNGTVEVDFSKPAGASAASTGSYSGTAWTVTPVIGYGQNSNVNNHALSFSGATLKNGNKTVELKVGGMQLKYIHQLNMTGVRSETGETLWGQTTWFTVNAWGPGQVPPIAACNEPNQYTGTAFPLDCDPVAIGEVTRPGRHTGLKDVGTGRFALVLPPAQGYVLRLYDVMGKETRVWKGIGPDHLDAAEGGLPRGLYFLRLEAGPYSGTLKYIKP